MMRRGRQRGKEAAKLCSRHQAERGGGKVVDEGECRRG